MVIHETGPASYGWNTVKNSNSNTMFDIVRQNPAATHTPFESWIQRDLAVRLFQASGLDFEAARAAGGQILPDLTHAVCGKSGYSYAAGMSHDYAPALQSARCATRAWSCLAIPSVSNTCTHAYPCR